MSRLTIEQLPSWMDQGACVNDPSPEDWFPEAVKLTPENKRAIEVCRSCPVVFQCRNFGRTQIGGIWGGQRNEEPRHLRDMERRDAASVTPITKDVKPEPLVEVVDFDDEFKEAFDEELTAAEYASDIVELETSFIEDEAPEPDPVTDEAEAPQPVEAEAPPAQEEPSYGLVERIIRLFTRFGRQRSD